MLPNTIKWSGFTLALYVRLAAANGYTYSGGIDFHAEGWDAAFRNPDIVHDNFNQAGNTDYWVNIAAADIPRPGYGGNVSSALALSLQCRPGDDEETLFALTTVRRHRLDQNAADHLSSRGEQKPIGPERPVHDDTESEEEGLEVKDLCATIYHLFDDSQQRARYDYGDCRSFLSDDCISSMMSETSRFCEDSLATKEPIVRSSAWCVGSDSAVTFGGIEGSLEWDAFWAYHGQETHDPANKSALMAMQEAVVPIVWHTRQSYPSGDHEFTVTSVACVRAGDIPARPRPTPTTTRPPVVTATSTGVSMPTATGGVERFLGAAVLAVVLVAA
ncbi:uncharacterized protein PG986_014603 [Apiospora aurea]|uniref:Uncharacterized protein n=1 Tax=Apiospora aurea TaxID=335848 RepID=A0ABR1PTZ8_9PEZI